MLKIGGHADHGFDEPLGLLSDCHRRIEFFLDTLLRVSRDERGRELSDGARRALERAITYFATAAPRHTADEEESLFPLLRASEREEAAAVMSVVNRLEEDHRQADAGHATVNRLASKWMTDGRLNEEEAQGLVAALESLQRIYEGHIGVEDRDVFPAASRLLSRAQLEEVGRQMAGRRGVRHHGVIARFFAGDHRRLDALLDAARDRAGGGHGSRLAPEQRSAFDEFRAGILKHIAMEEKRLIPAATAARGGQPLPIAAPLRADHGAIAALLVPAPRPDIIEQIRSVLDRHNPREEDDGGLYDQCDRALGAEVSLRLVEELPAFPAIRLKPYNDGPAVEAHVRETVELSRQAWLAFDRD